MHAWYLAVRGDEGAQLEARALLGVSLRGVGGVELHALSTSSVAGAVRVVDALARGLGDGAAAASDAGDGDDLAAQERAVALASAAVDGSFVFERSLAASLSSALVFRRAAGRRGWRLPVACAALAADPWLRARCLDDAATLGEPERLVARDDELQSLLDAMSDVAAPAPYALVRAAPGLGATRLVRDAAARAGARLHRCVVGGDGPDEEQVSRAITELCMLDGDAPRWLLVDARADVTALSLRLDELAARLPAVGLVITVSPECQTPWCDPAREVELGPFAPAEARAVVRAMLGDACDEATVARLARRGGAGARQVVETVRVAARVGELVREGSGDGARWRARGHRVLAPARRWRAASLDARRDACTEALTRRAWEAARAVGDGASEHALRGALRVLLGAPQATASLAAAGLVGRVGATVDLGRATAVTVDARLADRVAALRTSGCLDVIAEAERDLDARAPDASRRFARAARAALAVGDLAAAVRLVALSRALPRQLGDATVDDVTRAVADELGALVTADDDAPRPSLDPDTLLAGAAAREAAGDAPGAARLRALAALLQGDARPAMRVGEAGNTVRDRLLAALAHGRGGAMVEAVRSATRALADARRAGERAGEEASLAVLAMLYAAQGRDDDAARFTAAMRALPAA